MTVPKSSDPGAAISAALESVRSGSDGAESVWMRFINGDYCCIERTRKGWKLECDCGIRLETDSLSIREGPEIVLTASSVKHPAVFRMSFLPASVDRVYVRTSDGTTTSVLEGSE